MKHKINYDKLLIQELGNLRYDILEDFLFNLSKKIYEDSQKDLNNDRIKLAKSLKHASEHLNISSNHIKEAWLICKKYI